MRHSSRISILVLVCVFVVGLTIPVRGQEQQPKKTPVTGILGYLDPQTGAFRPATSPTVGDNEQLLAATTPTTGKLVFNFTISVQATISSTAGIACEASAELVDGSTQHVILENASVAATRSGTTAKCTVTIPYSWVLVSPTTDMVTLTYTLSAPTAAPALPSRFSSQTVAIIHVPSNGATTTETVSAVF